MNHVHVLVFATRPRTGASGLCPATLGLCGRRVVDYALATIQSINPSSVVFVAGNDDGTLAAAIASEWPAVRVLEGSLASLGDLAGHVRVSADPDSRLLFVRAEAPLLSREALAALVQNTGSVVSRNSLGQIVAASFAMDMRAFPVAGDDESDWLEALAGSHRSGRTPTESPLASVDEGHVVRTPVDLATVAAVLRQRKNNALMLDGVVLDDPSTTYIDSLVSVKPGTTIAAGVHLEGRTEVGEACHILSGVRITNSTLGARVTVLDHSVIVDSTIGDDARIGPFAHLRPQSVLGARTHVGNFVELKKTTLGEGSKANHLAYLGDATIGSHSNIGAGTITCNYDGVHKHQTLIGDRVFIGSDSQLVAPVCVGEGAYVAAGSTITKDVPANALAVSRGRQVNKEEWVTRRKENDV